MRTRWKHRPGEDGPAVRPDVAEMKTACGGRKAVVGLEEVGKMMACGGRRPVVGWEEA
ncbi:MAG TPA: hypothetical protein VHE54_02965 [Puia sp.]|nr:hypothetical protein [Puia sp.]